MVSGVTPAPDLRRRGQAEFVQNEIAGLPPAARTVLGQARIGQHFQQDRRDVLQAGLRFDLVGVVDWVDGRSRAGIDRADS